MATINEITAAPAGCQQQWLTAKVPGCRIDLYVLPRRQRTITSVWKYEPFTWKTDHETKHQNIILPDSICYYRHSYTGPDYSDNNDIRAAGETGLV